MGHSIKIHDFQCIQERVTAAILSELQIEMEYCLNATNKCYFH